MSLKNAYGLFAVVRYLYAQFMHLSRFIISFITVLLLSHTAKAQQVAQNMPEHDDKKYYFGITFGMNFSAYRFRYTDNFRQNDTFKTILSKFSPGLNLGIMGNLRLTNRFDLRTIPSLAFVERKVHLNMSRPALGSDSVSERSVESIYMHLPFQLKFKSDRIVNFRFYALAGVKFDFDLAANARSRRTDEFIKVKPFDMGYEIGTGFEFYYPNFIFSPEIKLSQGFMNQQFKDPKIPLSNALEFMKTRMIVISIHLEG